MYAIQKQGATAFHVCQTSRYRKALGQKDVTGPVEATTSTKGYAEEKVKEIQPKEVKHESAEPPVKPAREARWKQLEPVQWNVRNDRFAMYCLCGEPIAVTGAEASGCPNCGRHYRVTVEVQEPKV